MQTTNHTKKEQNKKDFESGGDFIAPWLARQLKPGITENAEKRKTQDSMKTTLLILLAVAVMAGTLSAQNAYTPETGSAERKAILDALRVPLERDLKQKVVFVAENFKVQGNWAYVDGIPQGAGGATLDYSRTRYADQVESGAFDNNFFALLKKTAGKWKITKYAIGCTDVCYLDWWRLHKAPKAIFPHTE